MIKLVRQGVYYMDGKLVKESHAFMTSEKKEKAVKNTISHGMKKLPSAPIVAIFLKGKLRRGVGADDVALAVLKASKRSGFLRDKILEYIGTGISALSMEMRLGIDSFLACSGRAAAVWETDEKTKEYYELRGQASFKEVQPKQPAYYDGGVVVDLSRVEPMLALSDGRIFSVAEFGKDPTLPSHFGSGTLKSVSYEDIAEAAEILRGKDIGAFRLSVCPTSREAAVNLAENGYFSALIRAGADICMTESCVDKESCLVCRDETGEEKTILAGIRTIAATAACGGSLTSPLGFGYVRRLKKYKVENKDGQRKS